MYVKQYEKSKAETECPFCRHVREKDYLFASEHFVVIPNKYPYPSQDHVMLIPRRHIHSTSDFTSYELTDFHQMETKLTAAFKRTHGMCFSLKREDTPKQSVWHQHTHYMSDDNFIGEVDRGTPQPLRIELI